MSHDYYDHGIAARARGQQLLDDIPDLLDDVMTRTDQLLDSTPQRALETPPPAPPLAGFIVNDASIGMCRG